MKMPWIDLLLILSTYHLHFLPINDRGIVSSHTRDSLFIVPSDDDVAMVLNELSFEVSGVEAVTTIIISPDGDTLSEVRVRVNL